MKKDIRDILELLVEKANHLESHKFLQQIMDIKFTIIDNERETRVEFQNPDEIERDAFILTFRFFYQKNERISFHNIQELLNSDLSEEWKDGISNVCTTYFSYLKTKPDNICGLVNDCPTRKDLLEAFLFGKYAHSNPRLAKKLKQWTNDKWLKFSISHEFYSILFNIFLWIKYMGEISQNELQRNPLEPSPY